MSSGGGDSLSSLFQPSSSALPTTGSSEGQEVKKKLMVTVISDGSVVGINAKTWISRRGDFIRAHVPISFKSWKDVPSNFKDDVWNALMSEFELDVNPMLAQPLIQNKWGQAFRTFKNSLRSLLKKGHASEAVPKGIDPHAWRKFLENESDPKKIAKNKQNAENRAKLKYSHCLGRCSYAQKKHIMEEKNSGIVIKRADAWLGARQHKNGTVLETAKAKVDEVKAAQNKRKAKGKAGEECDDTIEDFDSDVLAEVFGKQTKGGLRGVSSYITKKQAILMGVANSKIQQCKKATKDGETMKEEILSQVDLKFSSLDGILKSIDSKLSNVLNPPFVSTPPSVDIGSNSVHQPTHISQNLNNISPPTDASPPQMVSPIGNTRVVVNDKFGKVLARGHVITDHTANICHFKKVRNGEKKVYIEEVVDPDAPLWDAPQGGHQTLAGFTEGGFVIWLDL